MDRVEMMRLFIRVVETGSFSEAARIAGVAQSTVSKKVAGLESYLGAELLDRSSSKVIPTQDGQDYYVSALRLLRDLQIAEDAVSSTDGRRPERLRVAMSPGLGRLCVVPQLKEFLARYPDVSIDLDVLPSDVGEPADGIDVEIRFGVSAADRTKGEFIGIAVPMTVATPAYLTQRGEPRQPCELVRHDCIGWSQDGNPVPWTFRGPSGMISVMPPGALRTSDAECLRAAVLSHLGIGCGPDWLFAEDVTSGAVSALLTDYTPANWPISVHYPEGRRVSARVRALVGFLSEFFAARDDVRNR